MSKKEVQNKKEKDRPFLQHLWGPIVVGTTVLVGQFFINPLIAHKEFQRSQLLQTRQAAYLDGINLVDKFYMSLPWKIDNGKSMNGQPGPRPSRDEINQCLAQILLVEESPAISEAFLRCFGHGSEKGFSIAFRDNLVNQMRQELYSIKVITLKESPLFFNLDMVDTGPITANTNR